MSAAEKFRKIRESLKLTQEQFGDRLGYKHTKVRDIEAGKQKVSLEVRENLFRSYGVVPYWWDFGTGPMFNNDLDASRKVAVSDNTGLNEMPSDAYRVPASTAKIPIISWGQAGENGFFEDAYPPGVGFGEINRPYDVSDPGAYALIVKGDSMSPKFEPGDVVLASPAATVYTGDYAVVKLVSDEVAIKRIKQKNGTVTLQSINTDHQERTVPNADVVFMHKIVWQKMGG